MSYSSTSTATLFLLVILALSLIESAVSVSLTKRHIPGRPRKTVGGFSPIDVDDPNVKEIADFAITAISESSNSGPLSLIKIVKAESQIVAGRNYKLILELSSVLTAGGLSETEETLCEVIVFHQPWTQTRKLSKSNCLPIKIINSWAETREMGASANCQTPKTELVPDTPVHIVGGFSLIDVNDDSVKEMADFATTRISESSNSGPLTLIKIVKAESQVVAGKNYKLTLELGSAADGAVGSNLVCHVLVFHQPWTQTLELKQSSCLAPIKAETDIVTEILRAIDGRDDLSRIARYINASRDDLIKEFPLISSDGRKLSYTLFAPTSMAFMMQTPQDAGDPLVMDADFSRTVLIRHFVREYISPDDLGKLEKLIMADSNEVAFTRKSTNELCNLPPIDSFEECEAYVPSWTFKSNSGGCESYIYGGCFKTKNLFETEEECQSVCDPAIHTLTQLINETEIQHDAIPLATDFGIIYIIDRVFMSGEEVSEILRKHPSPSFGLFGMPIEMQPAVNTNENLLGRITGGYSTIDVNDAYIKEIADFAATAISKNANSGPMRLNRIIKAESQVVAGKNFKLTLELSSAVDAETDSLLCDVVIFEQWWPGGAEARQLRQSSCLSTKTVALWNTSFKQENDSNCLPYTNSANTDEAVPDTSVPWL